MCEGYDEDDHVVFTNDSVGATATLIVEIMRTFDIRLILFAQCRVPNLP